MVVRGLGEYSFGELAGYALAVAGAVVLTRIVWFYTMPYVIRALDRRPSQRARRIGARPRFVLAWSGMRGAVSLAAARAVALQPDAHGPVPFRDLIIFLTSGATVATLLALGR